MTARSPPGSGSLKGALPRRGNDLVIHATAGVVLVTPVAWALSGGWSWWWLVGVPVVSPPMTVSTTALVWAGSLIGRVIGAAWGALVGIAVRSGRPRMPTIAGASRTLGPPLLVTAGAWPLSCVVLCPCAALVGGIVGASATLCRRRPWLLPMGAVALSVALSSLPALWLAPDLHIALGVPDLDMIYVCGPLRVRDALAQSGAPATRLWVLGGQDSLGTLDIRVDRADGTATRCHVSCFSLARDASHDLVECGAPYGP